MGQWKEVIGPASVSKKKSVNPEFKRNSQKFQISNNLSAFSYPKRAVTASCAQIYRAILSQNSTSKTLLQ
jgi:hypothetical protein